MKCMEYSKIWLKTYFCHSETNIYGRLESFSSVSCRSSSYQISLRSRSTFQNLESTIWLAKHGKGMLSSVEQAIVGRDEKRAPLKTPAWEARASGEPWLMIIMKKAKRIKPKKYCHWFIMSHARGKKNYKSTMSNSLVKSKFAKLLFY